MSILRIFFVLFFSVPALADEGFFELKTLPENLHPAWDATAFFAEEFPGSDGTQLGSAVFVGFDSSDDEYGYFLSCEHGFRKKCGKTGECAGFLLYHDFEYNLQGKIWLVGDRKKAWRQSFEIIKLDRKKDLALLKMRLPKNRTFAALPIAASVNYREKIYAFGAPMVQLRNHWTGEQPSTGTVGLRWSLGIALDEVESVLKGGKDRQWLLSHTVDFLPGSSGGPLVNEKGELLGINARTAAANIKGYALGEKTGHRSMSIVNQDIHEFLTSTSISIRIK